MAGVSLLDQRIEYVGSHVILVGLRNISGLNGESREISAQPGEWNAKSRVVLVNQRNILSLNINHTLEYCNKFSHNEKRGWIFPFKNITLY